MKAILTFNAGSSSLKFALYPIEPALADTPEMVGQIEGIGVHARLHARMRSGETFDTDIPPPAKDTLEAHHRQALDTLLVWLRDHQTDMTLVAAGHRIVHGGKRYSAPMRLTGDVLMKLDGYVPLAPLHQPHNLRVVRAVARLMPELEQVGCFDTAFHRSQPEVAQMFALPRALTEAGIRRYGFHGLSYDFIARQLESALGAERGRGGVVVAHLGNGASMCAMRDGKSVASTMGFTAVDGLMMGTRTGSIDPGVLLYLMDQKGMDSAALTRLLYKESGLLGVSGISSDMRDLLASTAPEAREAVDLFCYRIGRELGSMAAAIGGVDAIVFTGGIGEHAAEVRRQVIDQTVWLGATLDGEANDNHAARIEAADSRVAIAVIPTNEEWMIARHTVDVLAAIGSTATEA
ncbi:acetate/propionate family kinase [Nitrogeniibacter mangrovi]|uniref:Acetate kinase n=1 Tax=Nitrogeniibacter mangrovi TaxID=2016596 RepID=A0A6C1AZK7_9RHOO|nr:acetate/propionate family kinase [Nitrogeniibacter mangrovi]QID16796.1 acetate/propionate family kinase [Nitrogeniibacter mangrovi]